MKRDFIAIAFIALAISLAAQAAKAQYTTAKPEIDLAQAIRLVSQGTTVYHCQEVELKINKSSISLKKRGAK